MIDKRFGAVAPDITERLTALSSDDLDNLGVAMFDFSNLADLESWLSRHQPNRCVGKEGHKGGFHV